MLEVAEVFRRHGARYAALPDAHLMPSQRHAMQDIEDCRTFALGGHLATCRTCGVEVQSFHSCRNRSCPACHARDTVRWTTARRKDLPDTAYFHLVFTVPQQLHGVMFANQKLLYAVLLRSAFEALRTLARDPRYVGGLIGGVALLHTWTGALRYHPHVHCLVPGGGLSDDGAWLPAREDFFVPVHALSKIYRAVFMRQARAALPGRAWPEKVWKKGWVTFAKPCPSGFHGILEYFARYVHRIAISNSRLVAIDDETVTFRFKRPGEPDQPRVWDTMTLPGTEFIRRYLLHVLPRGFHKVRYFGFLAPAHPARHNGWLPVPSAVVQPEEPSPNAEPSPRPRRCPFCRTAPLLLTGVIPRPRRDAPT